ncbi:MAG: hypothetical protein IPI45_04475 [Saprospiraceae bacterium]|nr:hypothetical protein [Saprospiraceae bacterium]MBK7737018.1 hypothetical protein [Saprospiraceae bacterium]MBK7914387.1 hypothetical protein [Saprospiraceae bacterium]
MEFFDITVTKKQICTWLGLIHPGGKIDYTALRREYFTDKALKTLGIEPDLYKQKRKFDTIQTKKILEYFKLTPFIKSKFLN